MPRITWNKVKGEIVQDYSLRKPLISRISKHFDHRYVVTLYTRFGSAAVIGDDDQEMLINLLGGSKTALSHKILLLINSPGGDPLAAERIIKALAEYSDNDYWALVPGTAKSAATMICLGATKVILSPTSELGPIDLQIIRGNTLIPAYSIITAYDNLIDKGIKLKEDQRIEPILQQLEGFDASQIEHFRQVNKLSEDIAQKVLRKGMCKKLKAADVKELIKIFSDPTKSKTHGRPIYYSDIKDSDKKKNFTLQLIKPTDKIWEDITEYHTRTIFHLTQTGTLKLIESDEMSYSAGGQ